MENAKILIYGDGWLGNRLNDYFNEQKGSSSMIEKTDIRAVGMSPIKDLTNFNECDVVINAVAKTDIDWCEKNKNETFGINTLAAANIAGLCKDHGKLHVFISSACIFESKDKEDVKTEESIPNPQCFYALSKVVAEHLILEANPRSIIIRPRLPISAIPHPRNTLNKLLGYEKLNDNQETVTIVEDMFPVLLKLITDGGHGVFHLVNEGTISPAELGEKMGHTFTIRSKELQDEDMKKEGKAQRVTTYATSVRNTLLPNVRDRVNDLVEEFNKKEKEGKNESASTSKQKNL